MTFKAGDIFEKGNTRLYVLKRDPRLQLWQVVKTWRWPWTKCWPDWGLFQTIQLWSDGDLAKRVSKFTKVN